MSSLPPELEQQLPPLPAALATHRSSNGVKGGLRLRRRRRIQKDCSSSAITMPSLDSDSRKILKRSKNAVEKKIERRGMLFFGIVVLLAIGLPMYIIYRETPFFTFENLCCRVTDHLWSSRGVEALEGKYDAFFDRPPLFGSEAYQQALWWGTYDPSKIFALSTAPGLSPSFHPKKGTPPIKSLTVAIAWYDDAHRFPVRHTTPTLRNEVMLMRNAQSSKSEEDSIRMEWMAHDGMHYGHLRVIDHPLHLTMEIEFLKRPAGDGWQVRVIGVLEPADPSQDRHPVHLVVYMLNDDEQEPVDLLIPSGGGIWKKADLSSPRLRTQMWNYDHTKVAVELRVREDYSPLASPKPWEIFSLHSAGGDTQEATSPFAFSALDMVGGRVRDRVDPITRKRRTSTTKDPQGSQWCDLRSLDCDNLKVSNSGEQDYYCIWKGGDSSGSREVPPEFSGNLVVMRRAYAADFRVELELAPADSFPTHPPSACRTTNVFRRREKKVKNYQTKFMRKGITSNEGKGPSGSFSHRLSTLAMSELLGSLGYYEGRYVSPTYLNESTSIKESYADDSRHFVFAFVGSRIEEPYGRVDITGLHLPFLVRYNKELAKGILHSWLSGSQDSRSGFVPSRTGFNAYVRSFMPKDLQWEETRLGSPPSILVGLTELLREMRRRHMQREGSDARLDDEVESDFAFLSELLPHLKGWRSWWHREQCGGSTDDLAKDCEHSKDRRSLEEWPRKPTGDPADQLGYRWRGRAGVSSLPTSGLDDYPRPVCAGHEHRELHVDLFSWIAYLSRIISTIEMEFLQREESVHVDWEAHLEALHWDEAQNRYSDRVGCPSNDTASASPPPFSPYVGYVNLYPVALGVSRRRIGPIFATMDLAKRQLSRSGRGLQSLSYSSVRLMREEGISHRNTFTGPIWPQHNLIYVYALATMYGPRKDRGWYEEEVVDERDSNDISWKDLQRVAGEEYSRLRDEMLPSLFQVSRWYECFSPITNAGLGSTTYIGSRALILPFLLDFT